MSARPLIGITADVAGAGPRPAHAFLYLDYADAVSRAGGLPVAVMPLADYAEAAALVERLDALVLSGGDDIDPRRYGAEPHPEVVLLHPRREAFELSASVAAMARGIPLLGVCNGIQTLNVALGGTLVVHLDPGDPARIMHRPPSLARGSHPVRIDPSSHLCRIVGPEPLRVNTYHHQAVDRLGEGLVACGHAPDGIVEAVEHRDHPFTLAVQWHPEKLAGDPRQDALFEALVHAARGRAPTVRRRRRTSNASGRSKR